MPEWHHWSHPGIFIVNFQRYQQLALNMQESDNDSTFKFNKTQKKQYRHSIAHFFVSRYLTVTDIKSSTNQVNELDGN